MLSLIIAATLIAATGAQSPDVDYCDICTDHTMCLYPTPDYGPKCRSPVYSGVNFTTQQQIVDLHNDLRRRVARGLEIQGDPGTQPPAANMRQLKWDDELAKIAQRWANQCISEQDTCRDVAAGYVGQNLRTPPTASTPNSSQNWEETLRFWYNEVVYFNKSKVDPFQYNPLTPDYTQLVWADTYLVGCAFTAFTGADRSYNKMYVCNYGPGGNIIAVGSSMYKIGNPGTQCPANTANNNGLCG